MFADITSVVATLSALVGLASLLVYLYFVRRSDFAAAREEALALAETRRETIRDLRARLE
jgi:predicted  nucleic acid-binding Zn-ribbon protein